MEHTASMVMTAERVPAGRLVRVGMLAAIFSTIANALVLAVASSLFGPVVIPPDEAVTFVFWGIAAVGLLLSFLPIAVVGVTGSSAGTLALVHVVAAATNVSLLTALARRR